MKIRNGFVSNSSSSSFIVHRGKNPFEKTTKLTTAAQDRKLKKYGFRKTFAHSADNVPPFYDKKAWKEEAKRVEHKDNVRFLYNYGYEVTCNQDEVSMFLVENKIPFVASCHYGQCTWIYTPELDRIIVATNVGRIMEMYGDLETYDTKNVVKVWKASEWLAEEKKIWEKINKEKEKQ
jgi:hypothetical protein